MITVAAVVVTRNRPALLKRCLAAIDSQTYPSASSWSSTMLPISRRASSLLSRPPTAATASTNTLGREYWRRRRLSRGNADLSALPCTHMWLMDDDCEPEPEAMAELVAAAAIVGEDAVLGSNIFDLEWGKHQRPTHQSAARKEQHAAISAYFADGLIEMRALTFVSFLVSSDLVRKVGLPLKEFFIWGDDTEYCLRLARFTELYQVGKSKTKHLKSGDASQRVFIEDDPRKISQYHWHYRNRLFVSLKYDGLISRDTIQFIYRSFRDMILSHQERTISLGKVPNDSLWPVFWNNFHAVDAEESETRSLGLIPKAPPADLRGGISELGLV